MQVRLADICARMLASGEFTFIALDVNLSVVAVAGELLGDVRVGAPIADGAPFLLDHLEPLRRIAAGEPVSFALDHAAVDLSPRRDPSARLDPSARPGPSARLETSSRFETSSRLEPSARAETSSRLEPSARAETSTRLASSARPEDDGDGAERGGPPALSVSVRAFHNDDGVVLLVQDTTRAADQQARSIQQRDDLARAQAALREARDAAEAASRSKSAFLANISHELRTPLNVIIGNAELLSGDRLEHFSRDELAGFARDIRESGAFLLDLINDLLDLSKAEAGRFDLIEASVDLDQLIEDCARLARGLPAAAKRTIEVSTAAYPSDAVFWGDEKRLRQIVVNLLSNAVKFTGDGGVIRLALAQKADGGATIDIVDDGVGMTAEEIRRIGAPFTSGKRSRDSVGLGLAIVKTLTELHDGVLHIDSAPGAGTRARVAFPPERARIAE